MKKSHITAGSLVLNIVLVITAGIFLNGWLQSQESLRQAEMKARYESEVRQLQIPAEALYRESLNPDHARIFRQICDLRKGYFPEKFLPYQAVVRPGTATIHQSDPPTMIANGSYETFWINEVNSGLAHLASQVEKRTEMGSYIEAQARQKDNAMIQLTERLLGSPNPYHRIRAARLLLALGHRDDRVIGVVRTLANEKMTPAITRDGTKMVHSWERNEAVQLDTQYQLGILANP
ncbi:MAG: hypothetical protein KJO79_05990 [Verrucomicrobiae bacterium]|nr:hypothetical protein [Verrucomicrobiae bacterium]NNJ86713.1 hypothetical protein [Akkermansiaceae bacterium]